MFNKPRTAVLQNRSGIATPRSLSMFNKATPSFDARPAEFNSLVSRRDFLWNSAGGLGAIALAWLIDLEKSRAAGIAPSTKQPHFPPKAKRVVQVFCVGGVSHLDTFDYKPELERMHGKGLE